MITQILNIDPEAPRLDYIIKAAQVLKQGGIVAFPTETVYGLGANFFDKDAVKKLYEIKQRPHGKPFTAHIADLADLERFGCDVSGFAKELVERFWPGPLTLIFNTSDSGKVGFRMPDNEIARQLIRQSKTLIAAPSANISDFPPPLNASEVLKFFRDKIELVLDAGPTKLGEESTIVDLTVFPYKIMRHGAVSKEKIAQGELDFWKNKVAPTIKKILFVCTGNSCRSVMAEGYLRKRLKNVERDDIEVFSRGISAPGMAGATQEALDALKAEGIDMSAHRAMMLTDDDIMRSDLILVMEEFHRREIIETAPSKKDRVYLLAEFGLWGGKNQSVPLEIGDPIGRQFGVYKESFNIIKNSIERLVKILI